MNLANSLKKIVFITGQLGLGGAEKQLFLLTRSLVQRGWNVAVVTLNGGASDFWESPIQEAGIQLHSIPAASSKASRVVLIKRILQNRKPTIVHSWTIYANIYAAIAGRLARTRCRIGSERANHHSSRRDVGNFWYTQSLRGLDALVTNSVPAARYLQTFKPRLRTFVVNNGVEIPSRISDEQKKSLRRELGIPESALVIGSIGTLVARKGFSRLMDATSSLAERWPSMHFVLIGDGPMRAELYTKATEALTPQRVHFLGAKPHASRFCPLFDVFCFPSEDQEGMPNVLMEAASWGIPSVATNVGSVREVVEDGNTGFVVDENDPKEMAGRIELLLSNSSLRKTMGECGREKVKNEFSVERMVTNMEEVYKTIV